MDYREELLNEIDRLHSLVESAIRDRSSYREGKHFYKLECAIKELNKEFPEEGIDLENIKAGLDDLRKIPKQESTD